MNYKLHARMSMDDMERIATEETLGLKHGRPDTPDDAEFRKLVAKNIADIKAKGHQIVLPSEWPEV